LKLVKSLIAAAVALSVLPTMAEARRGAVRTVEELHFVAETKISNPEGRGTLSLCHLIEGNYAAIIPLWYESHGYALAANGCDTDAFYPMSAFQVTNAKARGDIPLGTPSEPELSVVQKNVGVGWLSLLGLSFAILMIGSLRTALGGRSRRRQFGRASRVAKAALDAMCQAAIADGQIDGSEVEVIAMAGEKLTGKRFTEDEIISMIRTCASNRTNGADFASFGRGLTTQNKAIVMRAALMVVVADGALVGREADFIGKLAQGMKISGRQVNAWIGELKTA